MKELLVNDFYNTDYVNYGSYDNYRKIACFVDGLKPTSRKAVYTMLSQNINTPVKAANAVSKTIEATNYLHGEGSVLGVIVNCAQDFVGSNNIPYFQRNGNFGTRFVPEAAAARYIKTCKEKYLDTIFRPEDNPILDEQEFEGDKIEPKFFVPVLPMLFVNGSDGVSTGFAQKILPRSPKKLKEYLKAVLSGKDAGSADDIIPWYRGFKGKVKRGEEPASWEIYGSIEKLNATTYIINEVPVGYDLNDYVKVLDALEEKGVIRSYSDLSTDDKFKFEVKVQRNALDDVSEQQFMQSLKLVKKMTENYTCSNENLSVTEFKSVDDIMQAYIAVKKKYLIKRKDYVLKKLFYDITINLSKFLFIKGVVEDTIKVRNIPYDTITAQLQTIQNIIKDKSGTYDYLLNMPMHSMTKERYEKLKNTINDLKTKFNELKGKTIEQIWIEELDELQID